ncbi:hypothetical protein pb186bvf_014457 [Paramecium bursaria]
MFINPSQLKIKVKFYILKVKYSIFKLHLQYFKPLQEKLKQINLSQYNCLKPTVCWNSIYLTFINLIISYILPLVQLTVRAQFTQVNNKTIQTAQYQNNSIPYKLIQNYNSKNTVKILYFTLIKNEFYKYQQKLINIRTQQKIKYLNINRRGHMSIINKNLNIKTIETGKNDRNLYESRYPNLVQ